MGTIKVKNRVSTKENHAALLKQLSVLRKTGYTVRISHHRQLRGVIINRRDDQDPVTYGSRGEYLRAIEADKLRRYDGKRYSTEFRKNETKPKFCDVISPIGGFTTVDIYKGDELISSGKKNFTNADGPVVFVRNIGFDAAFGTAYGKWIVHFLDSNNKDFSAS